MADLDADKRSISELFEAALAGDYDDEEPREAVRELRHRSNPETEVLKVALGYCHSGNPKTRSRGLDVLAQLGAGKPDSERPWIEECVSVAIAALQDENSQVVHSAAWALAHLGGPRSVLALIKISSIPTPASDGPWLTACGQIETRIRNSRLWSSWRIQTTKSGTGPPSGWATFGESGTRSSWKTPPKFAQLYESDWLTLTHPLAMRHSGDWRSAKSPLHCASYGGGSNRMVRSVVTRWPQMNS